MTKQRTAVRMLGAAALPALILTLGCADRQTVASKSAAAYDEARRKGTPVGEGNGHGPAPGSAASPPTGGPHAAHEMPAAGSQAGDAHGAHAGARSGDHGSAATPHTAMSGSRRSHDTAQMKDEQTGHSRGADAEPGHGAHSAGPAERSAGMDHSKMDHSQRTGADHSGMTQHGGGMTLPPPKPEPPSATAAPGEPGATLRPDSSDAPAATAVTDAARSAARAAEMASGAHPMQHGTYVQTDAGRDNVTPPQSSGPAHGAHQAPRPPPGPTTPDPHRTHDPQAGPRPSPSPAGVPRAPSPAGGHEGHATPAPRTSPSPSPDSHRMHQPSPKPSPTPPTEEGHR